MQAKLPWKTLKSCRFNDFPSQSGGSKKERFFIFDDAYNSTLSFCEALKFANKFSSRKVAVVADMLELGNKSIYYHKSLAEPLKDAGFDYVLTLGKHCAQLKKALSAAGYENAYHFSSHAGVARFVKEKAEKGSLIFLKGSRGMKLEKVIDLLA